MHIVSHRTCGSRPPCTRHPIHACAPVRCVVVVSLHPSPFFLFVPLLFFQPFQMSSSEFHERLRSNPLCDFRLGTVATSDHETPLTNELDVQETNISFSQFNRNRKNLSGHWIETGWFACPGIMGSNCFCLWKYFSCFRWHGATRKWEKQIL